MAPIKKRLHTIEYLKENYHTRIDSYGNTRCDSWGCVINEKMLPLFGTEVELKPNSDKGWYNMRNGDENWTIVEKWINHSPTEIENLFDNLIESIG